MKSQRRNTWIGLLVAACFVLIFVSLVTGAEPLDWGAAWSSWRAGESITESPPLFVLVQLRLPRTLAALLAGAGLALAGCAFQVLLRNPPATPYTLGVASASALGAWTAFFEGR